MICKTCNNKGFIIKEERAFKCKDCYKKISKFQKDIKFNEVRSKFDHHHYDKYNKNIFMFVEDYIKTFTPASPSLYFHGPNSVGKSTLAKWLLFQIEQEYHLSVEYILFSELVRKLTEWDISSTENYRECDLLLVDDCFDIQKAVIYASKYQLPFIDEFFRRRLEFEYKPTILTSNMNFTNNPDIFIKDYNNSLLFLLRRNVKCLSFEKNIKESLERGVYEKENNKEI